jgi:hypothetical protein
VENSYEQTLNGLMARLPETVQVPPQFSATDDRPRVSHELRRFARKTVRGEMLCQVAGTLPSVPRDTEISRVVSLDVSRGGFGFLMDKQLYPGEEILLWTQIGRVPCSVARCLKHGDHCYEVGVEVRR